MSATATYVTDVQIGTPGSLVSLMNDLSGLQALMPALPALADLQPLSVARWRPDTPDPPCLYNVLLPSTSEIKDTGFRIRDTFVIATRIGTIYSDSEQHMDDVEMYADAYRALADANFWNGTTPNSMLKRSATWAMRSSMQSFQDGFGSVTVSGIEVVQSFWIDRHAH